MRLTWVSGDKEPQQVQYKDGKTKLSEVTTFSRDNMCSKFLNLLLFFFFSPLLSPKLGFQVFNSLYLILYTLFVNMIASF